ncbi:hypothetical protein TNIN_348551 [Trichonephila inaurata madagascariensis]|uniref:Uncharacterized protein n=1 Tax=Trichonephila inaurata madagascariensis TaxID=2747483 RepID=A0A8X7BQI6_9ARAC|nr:hypothetical protein TNIN_348551 [Trichonephila inaurata madagascariensis]
MSGDLLWSAEGLDPSCHTDAVDPALTFWYKWSTFHHAGRPAPDLWSISLLLLENLANNLQTVLSIQGLSRTTLVVPTPHALLHLPNVQARH